MDLEQLDAAEPATAADVVVRTMQEGDLDAIVRIDEVSSGVRRPRYFGLMMERSRGAHAMHVSLVAEAEGRICGFLVGSLYFGEYGIVEPSASIDAVGIDPAARRQYVARALMRQLRSNLRALGVARLRTEVAWSDFELLAFFRSEGFAPAPRLCLDCRLDETER